MMPVSLFSRAFYCRHISITCIFLNIIDQAQRLPYNKIFQKNLNFIEEYKEDLSVFIAY